MKLKIYNPDGSETKEKEVAIPSFEKNEGIQALKQCILAYLANYRQGNASTKDRGEVKGTGRKPWRQKGTGMARHGSKRSNIWRGGGVAHGPRPRSYSQKINRKVKALAFNRALSDCAGEGGLQLIQAFEAPEAKTKAFNSIIQKIYPEKGSILIVDDYFDGTILMAARNIGRVYIMEASSLNAWDFVNHNNVLMTEKGFDKVLERVNVQSKGAK